MNGTEILVGCGTLIGAAVGSFGAVRKWPFWKKNGKVTLDTIDQCQVPKCHDLVVETATEVKVLKEGQTEIFNRLNELPKDFIRELKATKGLFK